MPILAEHSMPVRLQFNLEKNAHKICNLFSVLIEANETNQEDEKKPIQFKMLHQGP